jgi:hypothetical protein
MSRPTEHSARQLLWSGGVAVVALFTALPALGTTVTNTGNSGAGSLRQAIVDTPDGGVIDFDASVTGTITLTTGGLVINKNVTIAGPGASTLAVDGGGHFCVFTVGPGKIVSISNLAIQHGASLSGGNVYVNQGSAALSNVVVQTGSASYGGGIYVNAGTLAMTNAVVSGNAATWYGGGVYQSAGSVTLANTTVSGNSAGFGGGGVFEFNGAMTLNTTTISGNAVSGSGNPGGGGVVSFRSGTVTLNNTTVAANTSDTTGGGIFSSGSVTLNNATIAGNMATASGGGVRNTASVQIKNSIVAGNLLASGLTENCNGVAASFGYNLTDDGSCGLADNTDIPVAQGGAGLDPLGLQSNDGPTQTVALMDTSSGKDAVPATSCTAMDGTPVSTDQRGVARPQGPACDIGAFELVPPPPVQVLDATSSLQDLMALLGTLDISHGISNSLDAKLRACAAYLAAGDTASATSSLQAFINAVNAQRGKKMSVDDADALIAAAQQVVALIGG